MVRLQLFDHNASHYERPSQPWVCGHAREGWACRVGPDRRGDCRATFECSPQQKDGRWECRRPASVGGKCAGGPLADGACASPVPPCVPVRSLLSRRGQTVRLCFAAVLGLLAVLLGGASREWLVKPGPLSESHAGVQQCGTCHASFGAGPIGWLHAAFAPGDPGAQSKPCLACHELGSRPLTAHGLASADLATRGARLANTAAGGGSGAPLVSPAAFTLPLRARGDIACATCHKEHKGTRESLTRVSDAACQSCHVLQFASLSQGHPAFRAYPFHRRTRVIFDHAAHYDRHFPKAKASAAQTECTSCHAIGPVGRIILVRSFDTSCSSCHGDEIRGKGTVGDKGIAVFTVPGLDLDTLRRHGAAIGAWPEEADGTMTPFMRLLLSADAATAEDLARLGKVSLLDLSHADDEQIAAAERIAWAVKALYADLRVRGPSAIGRAAASALALAPDASAAADMIGGLPQDVILSAEHGWFPDLASEVARHRAGKTVPTPGPAAGAASPASPAPAAPGEGPGTAGAILPGSGGILGTIPAPAAPASPSDQAAILPGGNILGMTPAPAAPASPSGQAAILPGGNILGTAPAPAVPASPGGQAAILPGSGSLLGASPAPEQQPAASASAAGQTAEAAAAEKPQPVDGETWSAFGGGWYRVDYTLYYRPAGHADGFIRAWLDTTGAHAQDEEGPAAHLFSALADPAAAGACSKCHSVDRTSDGARLVNWHARRLNTEEHEFNTTFPHAKHLSLFADDGCKACHKLDSQAGYMASYKGLDPQKFATAFRPIGRELCATCHVAGQAGDSCVTCHNYHIGPIPRAKGMTTRNVAN
ncbi:MAG: hypothetical protein ACHQF3_06545 [Alphaproteobacteria bacterium]